MLVIQPSYEHLREWVLSLPQTFFEQGQVIYDSRNQIRVITAPDGKTYNVKRYCCPQWYNRIAYTLFRAPKAQRAYDNAQVLLQRGIRTPQAVAYLLCGRHWLAESFLLTEQLAYPHRLYEWGDGLTQGREQAMRAFGVFTAKMHQQNILHLDYSPGNILYDCVNDEWQFAVVDINRMRMAPISVQQGCANMGRLWGEEAVYHLIAEGYATQREADTDTCYQLMWNAHQRFWSRRKKPVEYQSKIIQ